MMRFGTLTWSVIVMLLFTASCEPAFGGTKARPAAVAGSFYPAEPGALRSAVRSYLDRAVPVLPDQPLALIVPHAGYVYSGQIAADGFRQVEGRDYDVVVILGVNHRASGFQGISVYDGPGYRTPLGTAACDRTLADALRRADKRFAFEPRADASEHSVEVQIPFLQTVLPGTPIVPVVVGGHDERQWDAFAQALASALEGRKPLIVASSDLSHYPPHTEACASDRAVLAAVATLDPAEVRRTIEKQMRSSRADLATCACGEGPIVIALKAARLLGAGHAAVLSYANSGDTAVGDRSRCVGYGAVAILPGAGETDTAALFPVKPAPAEADLTDVDRRALLEFARATIRQYLDSETAPLFRSDSPVLWRQQGAFVTLELRGQLRGCIGHMAEDVPLGQVVGAMALQSAFNDHRFEPVTARELEDLDIEISVLTPFQPVPGPDAVVVGRDGVVLRKGGRSAVFLPQVATEQGWDRDTLLDQLSLKAGLPADAWRSGAQISVFQAEVFGERDLPRR